MTKHQDRSEQYVRQVADELTEQIQAGVAPWQPAAASGYSPTNKNWRGIPTENSNREV